MAKTHLDVGFTASAASVIDTYIEGFIPSAIKLAGKLRARGGPERFVWTTGSWLVDSYLERSQGLARRRAEEAIEAGDLCWHALPFTTHTELADVGLIEAGLEISGRLDHRFGRRTIAAKMTDVPGHTIGLVSLLASAGVEMLHIGVNPVARPPQVPPVFRWRDGDGNEVTVCYSKGGYGHPTLVEGLDDVLEFAHTGDNLGPGTVASVLAAHKQARDRFPGADVAASNLNAFAAALESVSSTLPVVEEEIGDTWIHGVGTDPTKVAQLKELLRLRRSWVAAGMVAPDDSRLRGFHENLLLAVEHSWGLDEKKYLKDRTSWTPQALAELRRTEEGIRFESSWSEQRSYVTAAAEAIDSPALRSQARSVLRALTDPLAPWRPGETALSPIRIGLWEIGWNGRGGIDHLVDLSNGRSLVAADHPWFELAHQSFDIADYERYLDEYVQAEPGDAWWAVADNSKPGLSHAKAGWWAPEGAEAHIGVGYGGALVANGTRNGGAEHGDATDFAPALIIRPRFSGEAQAWCSPPASELIFSDATSEDGPATLSIELRWQAKRADRRPEASWLGLGQPALDVDRFEIHKLGRWLDPGRVVAGGGVGLHAVDGGLRWSGPDEALEFQTLDAPLVAPFGPGLLRVGPTRSGKSSAPSVCLYNNVWGTNFPMWFEGSARFRFLLRADDV